LTCWERLPSGGAAGRQPFIQGTSYVRKFSAQSGAILLLGSALLAGCGDGGSSSTNNGAAALPEGGNEFTIGNDASAMETVGSNAGISAEPLPSMNMSAPGNAAAPAGAATGGNRIESNVAGM